MEADRLAMPNDSGASLGRYEVKSVARALQLLGLLAEHASQGLTVTEAASAVGTFAMLQTLVAYGYASGSDPGPRYRLGPAVLRLADSHTRSMPLIDLVRPAMRALTDDTGWTSRLAVHEHGYPMFIERMDGRGSVRFFTPLGLREMPHLSAAGKAILADLDEALVRTIAADTGLPSRTGHTITDIDSLLENLALVRARGFAVDDEEDEVGVLCIGASFLGRGGQPAGAVSITGLKADIPDWRLQEFARKVRAAADQMAVAIGGQPWRTRAPAKDAT